MDLTKKTARNSLYNLLAFVYPIILSLFATPFIIHKIGTENYGIFALATSFVGFLAFVDFGISPALVKYVAEYSARGEDEKVNRFFSTSVIFYALVGTLVGLGIIAFGATIAPQVFKVSAHNTQNLRVVFYWTGIGFVFTMLLAAYASLPGALQRFDIPSRISVVINTVSVGISVLLVTFGHGVVSLMALTTILSAASVLVFRYFDRKLVSGLKVAFKFDKDVVHKLFVFGGFATIGTIGGTILFQLDKVLIGARLGAQPVAFYVVPGNIATKINAAVATITAVIFPLSAELLAREEHTKLQALYTRSTRIVLTFLVIFVTPMIVLSHAFLLQWLGADYAAKSTLIMQLLLVTYSILGLSNIATHLTVGVNKPQVAALVGIFLGGLNIALLYILMPRYGIIGAAWAFLLSVIPILLFIFYVERQILHLRTISFYFDTARKLYGPFLLNLAVPFVLKSYIHSFAVFLLVYVVSVGVSSAALFVFRSLDPNDRELINAVFKKLSSGKAG